MNGLGSVPRLSLSHLPLRDRTVWSIGEKQVDAAAAPDGLEEHIVSVLSAWSAQPDVDLRDDEALGFTAAARAVARHQLRDQRYYARPVAMARYSAVRFEAAAATGLAVATSARVHGPVRRRVATVRFAHTFGVVAAAFDDRRSHHDNPAPSAWHGLPVFSAWVREPADGDPARSR